MALSFHFIEHNQEDLPFSDKLHQTRNRNRIHSFLCLFANQQQVANSARVASKNTQDLWSMVKLDKRVTSRQAVGHQESGIFIKAVEKNVVCI